MTLDLSCPALSASLHTSDPSLASRWLMDVLGSCPIGATVAVRIDGIDRGARVAARLMTVSEESILRAILAEHAIVSATPVTLFPTLTRKAA